MASTKNDQSILPLQARSGAGTTNTVFDGSSADEMRVYLNVTAQSGTTPTLTVKVQDSLDSSVWYDVAAFTQVTTTVGQQVLNIQTPFSDNLRINVVLGGTTPSYTYSVDVLKVERS